MRELTVQLSLNRELGLEFMSITDLTVKGVRPQTQAEENDIATGWKLLRIDGKPMQSYHDMKTLVTNKKEAAQQASPMGQPGPISIVFLTPAPPEPVSAPAMPEYGNNFDPSTIASIKDPKQRCVSKAEPSLPL